MWQYFVQLIIGIHTVKMSIAWHIPEPIIVSSDEEEVMILSGDTHKAGENEAIQEYFEDDTESSRVKTEPGLVMEADTTDLSQDSDISMSVMSCTVDGSLTAPRSRTLENSWVWLGLGPNHDAPMVLPAQGGRGLPLSGFPLRCWTVIWGNHDYLLNACFWPCRSHVGQVISNIKIARFLYPSIGGFG